MRPSARLSSSLRRCASLRLYRWRRRRHSASFSVVFSVSGWLIPLR
jgi:hypothetical protein